MEKDRVINDALLRIDMAKEQFAKTMTECLKSINSQGPFYRVVGHYKTLKISLAVFMSKQDATAFIAKLKQAIIYNKNQEPTTYHVAEVAEFHQSTLPVTFVNNLDTVVGKIRKFYDCD